QNGGYIHPWAAIIRSQLNHKVWIRTKVFDQFRFDLVKLQWPSLQGVRTLRPDFHSANVLLIDLCVRLAAFGQLQGELLREQRGGDDENDQQDESQVQERGDVDLAQGDQRTAL